MEQHLQYVELLLRHYRPGYDELSYKEQEVLIEHTSRYVNRFLEALDKLMKFVEHGTVQGTLSPAVKDAVRDIKVAEVHDVLKLSYMEIAEILGEPLPKNHVSKNDHPAVRKMGKRGRHILEKVFGKEGWKEKVTAMREEAEWWRSLSEGERWTERVSSILIRTEFHGMPLEEARAYVSRIVDRKARAQNVSREEAARRWAARYKDTILQIHEPE